MKRPFELRANPEGRNFGLFGPQCLAQYLVYSRCSMNTGILIQKAPRLELVAGPLQWVGVGHPGCFQGERFTAFPSAAQARH